MTLAHTHTRTHTHARTHTHTRTRTRTHARTHTRTRTRTRTRTLTRTLTRTHTHAHTHTHTHTHTHFKLRPKFLCRRRAVRYKRSSRSELQVVGRHLQRHSFTRRNITRHITPWLCTLSRLCVAPTLQLGDWKLPEVVNAVVVRPSCVQRPWSTWPLECSASHENINGSQHGVEQLWLHPQVEQRGGVVVVNRAWREEREGNCG
jgi:hypothetical protein